MTRSSRGVNGSRAERAATDSGWQVPHGRIYRRDGTHTPCARNAPGGLPESQQGKRIENLRVGRLTGAGGGGGVVCARKRRIGSDAMRSTRWRERTEHWR